MNKDNVQKAINVMQRVVDQKRAFGITMWQDTEDDIVTQEEVLHNCGTAACFGGWVAVSPEFQEGGGYADNWSGQPSLEDETGYKAIAHWLGISRYVAQSLCAVGGVWCVTYPNASSIGDVTSKDVIKALEVLRDAPEPVTLEDFEVLKENR